MDGHVEVKSSLAPWEGRLVELWVMVVCRVPIVERWGSDLSCEENVGIGRPAAAKGSISELLPLSLGNMPSFPILSPFFPLSPPQYKSFAGGREGQWDIWGHRECESILWHSSCHSSLYCLHGSGFCNSKARRYFLQCFQLAPSVLDVGEKYIFHGAERKPFQGSAHGRLWCGDKVIYLCPLSCQEKIQSCLLQGQDKGQCLEYLLHSPSELSGCGREGGRERERERERRKREREREL